MRTVKKINMRSMPSFLSDKEMKSTTGGYGDGGDGNAMFFCAHDSSEGVEETACVFYFNTAVAYCQVWAALGFACVCYPCDRDW